MLMGNLQMPLLLKRRRKKMIQCKLTQPLLKQMMLQLTLPQEVLTRNKSQQLRKMPKVSLRPIRLSLKSNQMPSSTLNYKPFTLKSLKKLSSLSNFKYQEYTWLKIQQRRRKVPC